MTMVATKGQCPHCMRHEGQMGEDSLLSFLTDDELSALIEACNVADRHNPRPPWGSAGGSAWSKLTNAEKARGPSRQ